MITLVGLNGIGRIGKCIFLQLLNHPQLQIRAINILDYDINQLEKYLKYDSIHKYNNNFTFEIINENTIKINDNTITIFNERDASKLKWSSLNINYVIDATGFYLTEEKALKHNVEHVIISAPSKDNTPMFVYGVNEKEYKGEKVISNASCTTNCITPLLKILDEHFKIVKGNFTTVHASTSSQSITDTLPDKNRTYRSIYNSIIPHTTGASKAIDVVLPKIKGLIKGTSLRVPVNNVSIVDCNIQLEENTDLNSILEVLRNNKNVEVNDLKLVSNDFMSTTCPTIVDSDGCMELGNNEYKFMVWYDNEWSYSAQLIRMLNHCVNFDIKRDIKLNPDLFIHNGDFKDKQVLMRVDYNVPLKENNIIQDSYRIDISIDSIKYLLNNGVRKLILVTHFGRPKQREEKYSVEFMTDYLERLLKEKIYFLRDGFSLDTLRELNDSNYRIYLIENVRFHKEEIHPTDEYLQLMNEFCDIYINDAFGCCHRGHSSIIGFEKPSYYGYVIKKEVELLNTVLNSNKKTLAIIGGAKMDTKLVLLRELCKKVDTIFIGGGNVNSILKNNIPSDFMEEIQSHKAEIVLMVDGFKSSNLNSNSKEYSYSLEENEYFYDCGHKTIDILKDLIKDHENIFWNGVLGMVENVNYKNGSMELLKLLEIQNDKKIIAGGGDTVAFIRSQNNNGSIELCSGGGASIDYLCNQSLIGLHQFE